MRKIRLDNVYESPVPLDNINNLWGDIDENTGELLAIHKYDAGKGEWEPYMVSVEYIKPDGNEATINIVNSNTGVRVKNVTNPEDSSMAYQLIQVVLPDSPFYGEVSGTQTRVHAIADGVFVGDGNPGDYDNVPLMDILVCFLGSRNGFPFDPENYRVCKIRIVASEDDLEIDSDTITHGGCIPSVKFTKYTILNN